MYAACVLKAWLAGKSWGRLVEGVLGDASQIQALLGHVTAIPFGSIAEVTEFMYGTR